MGSGSSCYIHGILEQTVNTSALSSGEMLGSWRSCCSSPEWGDPYLCGCHWAIWQHAINPLLPLCSWVEMCLEGSYWEWSWDGFARCCWAHKARQCQLMPGCVLWLTKCWSCIESLELWSDASGPFWNEALAGNFCTVFETAVTPRHITEGERKAMIRSGWQIFLPTPREALGYLRCFKCWAEAVNMRTLSIPHKHST